MKVEGQIILKIAEHEKIIDDILNEDQESWTDIQPRLIESYLIARKVLQWVLSDNDFIEIDDYEKKAKYECLCYESSKIF